MVNVALPTIREGLGTLSGLFLEQERPDARLTQLKAAIDEMQRVVRGFGADRFGHMEDFARGEVTIQFVYRAVPVTIKASSKGYAMAWLRQNPWSARRRCSEAEHQHRALRLGQVAVYSILRDWLKGQITAIEVGLIPFEGAFLGQIMLPNGETVLERIAGRPDLIALPAPEPKQGA